MGIASGTSPRGIAAAITVFALSAACASSPTWADGGRWVDLTHDFSEDTLVWPTSDPFELEVLTEGQNPKGYWYAAKAFASAEHGGTHVDAPYHFCETGRTIDEIPVGQLIGPAVVVDVTEASAIDPDYQVDVVDLLGWEVRHGPLPDGAIVLLRTGRGALWPDAVQYMGTDLKGAEGVAALHFPGLSPAAARWLVEERHVGAVGIDTPSIDHGPSTHFETHVILAAHDIPAFENVADMSELPEVGAVVVALPMKIRGGTGAPLRLVAWLPEGDA